LSYSLCIWGSNWIDYENLDILASCDVLIWGISEVCVIPGSDPIVRFESFDRVCGVLGGDFIGPVWKTYTPHFGISPLTCSVVPGFCHFSMGKTNAQRVKQGRIGLFFPYYP
jgi:hypothetical protein